MDRGSNEIRTSDYGSRIEDEWKDVDNAVAKKHRKRSRYEASVETWVWDGTLGGQVDAACALQAWCLWHCWWASVDMGGHMLLLLAPSCLEATAIYASHSGFSHLDFSLDGDRSQSGGLCGIHGTGYMLLRL